MNKKISLDIKKKRGYNTRIEGKGAVNQHLWLNPANHDTINVQFL